MRNDPVKRQSLVGAAAWAVWSSRRRMAARMSMRLLPGVITSRYRRRHLGFMNRDPFEHILGRPEFAESAQVEFSKKNPTQNPTHQVNSHQPDQQDSCKSLAIKGLFQRDELEQHAESLFESVGWRFEPSPASSSTPGVVLFIIPGEKVTSPRDPHCVPRRAPLERLRGARRGCDRANSSRSPRRSDRASRSTSGPRRVRRICRS